MTPADIAALRARVHKEYDAVVLLLNVPRLLDEIERLRAQIREVTETYKPGWAQGLHALAIQLGWVEDRAFAGDYCPASFLDDKMREIAKDSRARAIRAVVAAQWAVACMLVRRRHDDGTCLMAISEQCLSGTLTGEQIVDGVA